MTYAAQPVYTRCTILLGLENVLLKGKVEATSSAGGDFTPGRVVSPHLDTAWESGPLSTGVSIDGRTKIPTHETIKLGVQLLEPRAVDTVTVHRHNVQTRFRVHVYESPTGDGAPKASSLWHSPVVRGSLGDYPWETLPWFLGPNPREVSIRASSWQLESLIKMPAVSHGVRYLELEIDNEDGRNGALDYFHIGYLHAFRAFRPRVNVLAGAKLTPDDRSTVALTASGSRVGRRQSYGNKLAFEFSDLTEDEAFRDVLNFNRRQGTLSLVFAWLDPDQRQFFYEKALLGTPDTLSPVVEAQRHRAEAPGWVIREEP